MEALGTSWVEEVISGGVETSDEVSSICILAESASRHQHTNAGTCDGLHVYGGCRIGMFSKHTDTVKKVKWLFFFLFYFFVSKQLWLKANNSLVKWEHQLELGADKLCLAPMRCEHFVLFLLNSQLRSVVR